MKNTKCEIKRVLPVFGSGRKLANTFNVTEECVSRALRGRSNSELAQRIRRAAVEMGGDAVY